uniref:NADH-ubiquinone oxidoreductase chain 2 n=1 Tax=Coelophthinia sp. 1 JPL-2022a TaxID=3002427 RepID=A0A9E8MI19_9DIPT|nr:NADH dehydrogenase subunit 2 [Coelophthinia sp. 1 JPL-2022a]
MFKNPSNIIFFIMMTFGTIVTISSNSWLSVWMGLEINLLSFIPLMIDTNNLMSTEASLKYFLTQAFASSMLLFSILLFMLTNNVIFQLDTHISSSILMFTALMIKSGIAPFHFWFPSVMEGISWIPSLILMTWQKIAPMMITSYFMNFNFFFFFIVTSVMVGAISGLNQTSIRKLMAFSSINHMGWMLSAMLFNECLWLSYFFIYSFMSIGLIMMFTSFKLFYINQMFNLFVHSYLMKFFMLVSLLSLGGLPPFLGFLPKWMVIQSLMSINQMLLILLMIMSSLITLYFYLRICYSAFMLNYLELNFFSTFYNSLSQFSMMIVMLFSSMFGLFLFISLIYLLY